MRGDRMVSALFASRRAPSVRLLPHRIRYNCACSGFHPPASVMKLLSPTQHRRLNEVTGLLLFSAGLVTLLSLVSYHAQDPSWDTASDVRPLNLIGYPGAFLADIFVQLFGAAAMLLPLMAFLLSWKWLRSEPLEAGGVKVVGSGLFTLSVCTLLSFLPLRIFGGTASFGGAIGVALARCLIR